MNQIIKEYPSSNLGFGEAMELLKSGLPMYRQSWNGKGLFIYYVPAASYPAQSVVAKSYFGNDALVPYAEYIALKNADNTVSTWAPSIGDALSHDWAVATYAPHFAQPTPCTDERACAPCFSGQGDCDNAPSVITPTIGRIVWYWPPLHDEPRRAQPWAAIVTRVWNDRMVNITFFDHEGRTSAETSVRLLQGDDQPYPNDGHVEWMPYQKGQPGAAWKKIDMLNPNGTPGPARLVPDPAAVVPEGLSDEQVARVCHEVNRAYCAALGDHSQVAWEDAPEWQRASARMGVDLHRMLPDASPAASHEAWGRQKLDDGWTYGPVKDETLKQHPCLVPFAQLSVEQQAKDFLFKAVVNALTPLN